jgi:K+-sensing histidine kinase KdpD
MDVRRFARDHRAATVAVAAAAPLLAAALLSLVRSDLTAATDVLVLVALVVLFSATGIRAAGLAAALSAVVWFDVFLTQPYGSLAINDPDDLEAAALLLVIGGVVTETALWGQRQQAALSKQLGYVDGVLATAESIALRDQGTEEVTSAVAQRIREVLNLDACTFAPGGRMDPSAPTLQHDGSLTQGDRELNVDRDGLPVDSTVVLPVRWAGEVRGRFLLTAASHVARPTSQQRRVAVLLADQVAGALHDPGPTRGRERD